MQRSRSAALGLLLALMTTPGVASAQTSPPSSDSASKSRRRWWRSSAAHWGLLLVVIAFWALVYAPTMERERANIRERFPDAYDNYSANVPAFVPRLTPWNQDTADDGGFSADLYMKHGEWKAGITYLLVMGWLAFRMTRGV